jgi:hypothetical protein
MIEFPSSSFINIFINIFKEYFIFSKKMISILTKISIEEKTNNYMNLLSEILKISNSNPKISKNDIYFDIL